MSALELHELAQTYIFMTFLCFQDCTSIKINRSLSFITWLVAYCMRTVKNGCSLFFFGSYQFLILINIFGVPGASEVWFVGWSRWASSPKPLTAFNPLQYDTVKYFDDFSPHFQTVCFVGAFFKEWPGSFNLIQAVVVGDWEWCF